MTTSAYQTNSYKIPHFEDLVLQKVGTFNQMMTDIDTNMQIINSSTATLNQKTAAYQFFKNLMASFQNNDKTNTYSNLNTQGNHADLCSWLQSILTQVETTLKSVNLTMKQPSCSIERSDGSQATLFDMITNPGQTFSVSFRDLSESSAANTAIPWMSGKSVKELYDGSGDRDGLGAIANAYNPFSLENLFGLIYSGDLHGSDPDNTPTISIETRPVCSPHDVGSGISGFLNSLVQVIHNATGEYTHSNDRVYDLTITGNAAQMFGQLDLPSSNNTAPSSLLTGMGFHTYH